MRASPLRQSCVSHASPSRHPRVSRASVARHPRVKNQRQGLTSQGEEPGRREAGPGRADQLPSKCNQPTYNELNNSLPSPHPVSPSTTSFFKKMFNDAPNPELQVTSGPCDAALKSTIISTTEQRPTAIAVEVVEKPSAAALANSLFPWSVHCDSELFGHEDSWVEVKTRRPEFDLTTQPTAHDFITAPYGTPNNRLPTAELDISCMVNRHAARNSHPSSLYDYTFVNQPIDGMVVEQGRVRSLLLEEQTVGIIVMQWSHIRSLTWRETIMRSVHTFNKASPTWKVKIIMVYQRKRRSVQQQTMATKTLTPPVNDSRKRHRTLTHM